MRRPIAVLAVLLAFAAACAAQTNELRRALKMKPDAERGRELYAACVECHRTDGSGSTKGDIPAIAGQHYQVLLKQMTDFRQTERFDLRMEAVASRHQLAGAQELADIAAYIASLPVPQAADRGPGRNLAIGARAYERACAHCHGRKGEGDNALRHPRLASQNYGYLVKQMDMMISGMRPNISWDHSKLVETLTDEEITGIAGWLARLDAGELL